MVLNTRLGFSIKEPFITITTKAVLLLPQSEEVHQLRVCLDVTNIQSTGFARNQIPVN